MTARFVHQWRYVCLHVVDSVWLLCRPLLLLILLTHAINAL